MSIRSGINKIQMLRVRIFECKIIQMPTRLDHLASTNVKYMQPYIFFIYSIKLNTILYKKHFSIWNRFAIVKFIIYKISHRPCDIIFRMLSARLLVACDRFVCSLSGWVLRYVFSFTFGSLNRKSFSESIESKQLTCHWELSVSSVFADS